MNRSILLYLLLLPLSVFSQSLSPEKVLEKSAAVFTASKGISVNFKISGEITGTGSLIGAGNKFHVSLPDAQVWYNGKEMYSYNMRIGETTVISPSAEELQMSNPFLYFNTYKGKFKAEFSRSKIAGRYVVLLKPLTKATDLRSLAITVRSSDFIPEKIVAETTNGSSLTFNITSFKTGLSFPPSDFEYPRSRYPKVEIIDLR